MFWLLISLTMGPREMENTPVVNRTTGFVLDIRFITVIVRETFPRHWNLRDINVFLRLNVFKKTSRHTSNVKHSLTLIVLCHTFRQNLNSRGVNRPDYALHLANEKKMFRNLCIDIRVSFRANSTAICIKRAVILQSISKTIFRWINPMYRYDCNCTMCTSTDIR